MPLAALSGSLLERVKTLSFPARIVQIIISHPALPTESNLSVKSIRDLQKNLFDTRLCSWKRTLKTL